MNELVGSFNPIIVQSVVQVVGPTSGRLAPFDALWSNRGEEDRRRWSLHARGRSAPSLSCRIQRQRCGAYGRCRLRRVEVRAAWSHARAAGFTMATLLGADKSPRPGELALRVKDPGSCSHDAGGVRYRTPRTLPRASSWRLSVNRFHRVGGALVVRRGDCVPHPELLCGHRRVPMRKREGFCPTVISAAAMKAWNRSIDQRGMPGLRPRRRRP